MCRARSNYRPFQGSHRSFSVVLGKDRFVCLPAQSLSSSQVMWDWRCVLLVKFRYAFSKLLCRRNLVCWYEVFNPAPNPWHGHGRLYTDRSSDRDGIKRVFKKGVAASELKVFLAQENWKDSSRLHHSVREQFLKAAWFSFACFFRRWQ